MDLDPAFVRNGLIVFLIIVASVSLHEWGHAFVADLLGDDTPRADGRLTLNPMAHIDMVGTILIPLVNLFVFRNTFTYIAWGRPVATNPSNPLHRHRDVILVALAGPCANLLFALVAVLVGAMTVVAQPRLAELVDVIVVMNVGLAVFNMLPIPPLDGAAFLRPIIGMSEETYMRVSQWSWLIFMLVINLDFTRELIALAISVACAPYVMICTLIRPAAAALIF